MKLLQTNVVQKIKTHFIFKHFSESRAVYEITWKNMLQPDRPQMTIHYEHAHCLLDNWGYRHTLRICNTYCFSAATVFTWMLPSDTLHFHCLSSCHRFHRFLRYVKW